MHNRTLTAYLILLFPGLFCPITLSAQDLYINEVVASNSTTIYDEDGDAPDWFEIYNISGSVINLSGYSIADSGTINNPWVFPSIDLGAGEHLLVFASDKDRSEIPLYWTTAIDMGDTWKYIVPLESIGDWRALDFDDSEWLEGKSGFGYSDGDDSTVVEQTLAIFLRKTFEVDHLDGLENAILHMDYDDGFVAYLNGIEIARGNMEGDFPAYDQPSSGSREAIMYGGGQPEKFEVGNISDYLVQGENVLAIQVHNVGTTSSDMTAIPIFSMGSTQPLEGQVSPYVTVESGWLHTHFKISADGETLFLRNATGDLIDSITTGVLKNDISIGRSPDGSGDWRYFAQPTPGSANNTQSYEHFSNPVHFSIEGGLLETSIVVELSSEVATDSIYYTMDGSDPAVSGQRYQSALTIWETTVLRAVVRSYNSIPENVATQTYIIKGDHGELPIISLSTDPDNLWDYERGIYVMGPNAESEAPFFGANFWQDWERPIHIEMFEPDGTVAFSEDAGVKIFGGWTRGNDQKSLAIFFRKSYGNDEIRYQVFPQMELDRFSHLVLRNAGNDWNWTHFRDAFCTSLFDPSLDKQAYRPAVIYINGEYWGIQNIREKVNEDFLGNHHCIDPDGIDLLEGNGWPIEGNEEHYRAMVDFISSNDMSEDSNYEFIQTQMDVTNFIWYQVGNIFIDNQDWPGNNIKFWRSDELDGKWRWIAYDTEFSSGLYEEGREQYNTFNFAFEANGPDWPNPPWSTLILRRLIENESFRNQFINSFADKLNTVFQSDFALNRISAFESVIQPEINNHLKRWNSDYGWWAGNVSRLKSFFGVRDAYMRTYLGEYFGLDNPYEVEISVNETSFGKVQINSLELEEYPWSGWYYPGVPVVLQAIPRPGYRFDHWEGNYAITGDSIKVDLQHSGKLKAVFELENPTLNSIVINEIFYQGGESGDWVEFYNRGTQAIDMSGWVVSDDADDHQFLIPSGESLAPGAFILVCRSEADFSSVYGENKRTIGNMDFGLSSNDCVRLYNQDAVLVNRVCYTDQAPWPELTDSPLSTIALEHYDLDNEKGNNWNAAIPSPGDHNFPILSVKDADHTTLTYPNPATLSNTIYYAVRQSGQVTIELIDLNGKNRTQLFQGKKAIGHYQLDWNTTSVPDGFYLIVIHDSLGDQVMRLIVE